MTEDFIMLGDKKFANKTRDGRPVRIICDDRQSGTRKPKRPFIILVTESDGSETSVAYTEHGVSNSVYISDLAPYVEPDEVEFRNVYADGGITPASFVYHSIEDANIAVGCEKRIAILAINKTKGTVTVHPVKAEG